MIPKTQLQAKTADCPLSNLQTTGDAKTPPTRTHTSHTQHVQTNTVVVVSQCSVETHMHTHTQLIMFTSQKSKQLVISFTLFSPASSGDLLL